MGILKLARKSTKQWASGFSGSHLRAEGGKPPTCPESEMRLAPGGSSERRGGHHSLAQLSSCWGRSGGLGDGAAGDERANLGMERMGMGEQRCWCCHRSLHPPVVRLHTSPSTTKPGNLYQNCNRAERIPYAIDLERRTTPTTGRSWKPNPWAQS